MSSKKIVQEGDTVILKKDSDSKVIKIISNKACGKDDVIANDNRNLIDDKTNQKLTKEEIQEMRKTGIGGEAIVDNLIVNSSTFSKKTDFSKQKYVNKKSKKHVTVFTLLECNTRNLLEMYHSKGPTKICNLRMDSLAQILCHANIHHGGRYLVVDGCLGLVLGSIIERLNGSGLVMNLYTGSAPSRPAIHLSYQFVEEQLKVLHDFPLINVAMLKPHVNERLGSDGLYQNNNVTSNNNNLTNNNDKESVCDERVNVDKNSLINSISETNEEEAGDDDDDIDDNIANDDDDDVVREGKHKMSKPRLDREERDRRRKERREKIGRVKLIIEENSFDGLIIATRMHTTPLLRHLLRHLSSSRPFVVFSPYKEVLMDSYMFLKDSNQVVLLKMFETWLRNYQILPERSHPHVNMSGSGGYLLTGFTVHD
ncbi:hypothetical protein HELRODRAFT_170048 [Helobdella robusta]|uniref:tRNA (adenine(58)-N(1))-methyltransferase non-catalytic subunit TRM6 n=1 Tax=Helobdella robusta TaxID=6412 RepID=T1F2K9_HELRO|nr:hypothetical protein HELRODRAFT_170048 [Helobdella robusta]ESO07510.1 hypothetical protein HELRODRAFT_170048 [Helobdella robusta]